MAVTGEPTDITQAVIDTAAATDTAEPVADSGTGDAVVKTEGTETVEPGDTGTPPVETPPADSGTTETVPPVDDQAKIDQAKLQEIMTKGGFEDPLEVLETLDNAQKVVDALQGRDLTKALEDSDKLGRYEEHWATERMKEQEKSELPEQTIERLKNERQQMEQQMKEQTATNQAADNSQKTITDFNQTVAGIVDAIGELSDVEKGLYLSHLGVDNPMDDIDVQDLKTVRVTARDGAAKFKAALEVIKQGAIDNYAAGKGKIVPTAPDQSGSTTVTTVAEGERIDVKGLSVEDAFSKAKKTLMGMISGGTTP